MNALLGACWTTADAAELDTLTWTLVADYFEHRQRCRACAASRQPGGLPCPHLQAAIREVCDWRQARQLLSAAEALRAERGRMSAERNTP